MGGGGGHFYIMEIYMDTMANYYPCLWFHHVLDALLYVLHWVIYEEASNKKHHHMMSDAK